MATKKANKESENIEAIKEEEKKVEPAREDNMVTIQLIKDSSIDKYKHDMFVGVNGKTFQIQRGVQVKVPAYVAEVIRHSQQADQLAQSKRDKLAMIED